jgi:hypothetical protein
VSIDKSRNLAFICVRYLTPTKVIHQKKTPEMSLNEILEVFDSNVRYNAMRTSEVGATLAPITLGTLKFSVVIDI